MGSKIDPDFEKKIELIKIGLKKKEESKDKIKKIEDMLKERKIEEGSIKTDITELKLSLYKLTKNLNSLKKELEDVKTDVAGLEQITGAVKDVEALRNDINRIEAQFHAYRENMDRFVEESKKMDEAREEKENEFALKSELRTVEEKLNKTANELRRFSDINASIENMKADIEDLLNLKGKVAEIGGIEEGRERVIEDVKKSVENFEKRFDLLADKVQKTSMGKISSIESRIKEMENEIKNLKLLNEKIGEISSDEKTAEDFLVGIKEKMENIESKLNEFKDDVQKIKLKKITSIENFIKNLSKHVDELQRFKNKTENDKTSEEIKKQITALKWKNGELEAMLEDLKTDILEIKDLEKSSNNQKEIKNLNGLIVELREKIKLLEEKISKNREKIGEVRFESEKELDRHVKILLMKLNELERQKEEIKNIKEDITSIEGTLHDFENFKKRVSEISAQMLDHFDDKKIEEEVNALAEKMRNNDKLYNKVKIFESSISELKKNIMEMKAGMKPPEMADIKKTVELLKRDMAALSNEISRGSKAEIKDVDAVQEAVSKLEIKISAIEENIESLKSLKNTVKSVEEEIAFLRALRLDVGRIMEDVAKMEEIHGYVSEIGTLRKDISRLREDMIKTRNSFEGKIVKLNNTLSSKEERLENAIAEVDLMRKRESKDMLNKISLLKEKVSEIQEFRDSVDSRMRDQELRILDSVAKEREQAVKREEIYSILEELKNLRSDVNTLQDIAENIEELKEEMDKKSDSEEYKALEGKIQKQAKTMDEMLKTFSNFAKKGDIKTHEDMIAVLADKISKLKERIRYESKMMENILKTFESQREEFRTVLRQQNKTIEEKGEMVDKRIDKLSELLEDAKRAMAEIGYIKNTLVSRKEFITLEERVFEIEEVLRKFELERAEMLK